MISFFPKVHEANELPSIFPMNASALQHVDLATKSGDPVDGLVSISKPPKGLPASERVLVEKAASHGGVA